MVSQIDTRVADRSYSGTVPPRHAHDDVWVIVPMYNEATCIQQVVSGLVHEFPNVLCVDDGSQDDSLNLAATAGANVLRHAVNLGQGAALRTGFEYVLERTDATAVVTFDADGQHQVADAVAMVAALREKGCDVVLGTRGSARPEGQPEARRWVLRAALAFSRASSGLDLSDTHNGLRVLSREAVSLLRLRQRGMAYASELENLVARHRLSWIEHPVNITYSEYSRRKGQSNLNALNILFDLAFARVESR